MDNFGGGKRRLFHLREAKKRGIAGFAFSNRVEKMANHLFIGVEQRAKVWCSVGLWHQNPITVSFWVRPFVENGGIPDSRKQFWQKRPVCIQIIAGGLSVAKKPFRWFRWFRCAGLPRRWGVRERTG